MATENDDPILEYQELRPRLEAFSHALKGLVGSIVETDGLDVHVIEQRTKTVKSFGEKINRSGKTYTDPVRQITDLVGLRIVLYYPEDVDVVCSALRREFKIDDKQSVDKRLELAPDQFGYVSVHLIGQLSRQRSKLTEWKSYADIRFELQVRTVLQHAWASISHAFQYKQDDDTSPAFKRRLGRLAGLLELADDEFSALRQERERFSERIVQKIKKKEALNITNSVLIEYLGQSELAKRIGAYVRESGMMLSSHMEADQLLTLCEHMGITKVAALDKKLTIVPPYAAKFFPAFSKVVRHPETTSGSIGHWVAVALWARYSADLTERAKKAHLVGSAEYQNWIQIAAKNIKN